MNTTMISMMTVVVLSNMMPPLAREASAASMIVPRHKVAKPAPNRVAGGNAFRQRGVLLHETCGRRKRGWLHDVSHHPLGRARGARDVDGVFGLRRHQLL